MRFAFVVSRWLGYQIPNLFEAPESLHEFEKALELLKLNGFQGVELNLHLSDKSLLMRIKEAIKDSGLSLAAVGTGLLYGIEHLSFTDHDPVIRTRAVDAVKDLVKFASEFNSRVIIGMVRGSAPLDRENAAEYFSKCIQECDSTARDSGIKLALEAINRYETQSLNTAEETAYVIDRYNLRATGLLLDTFHMNIEERSIERTISTYASRVEHFHIADSNRWPPGNGHLDIAALLERLKDSGYAGWVSTEALPYPSRVEGIKETADYLRLHNLLAR